jgi:hypothetical protein
MPAKTETDHLQNTNQESNRYATLHTQDKPVHFKKLLGDF